MAGFYRISNDTVPGGICNIPHKPLCNYCDIIVFFPRTRERNREKIFLANNHRRNRRGHPGNWINQFNINPPTKWWVFFSCHAPYRCITRDNKPVYILVPQPPAHPSYHNRNAPVPQVIFHFYPFPHKQNQGLKKNKH